MTLVFDTSVLSCFARAGRLELLDRLTRDHADRVTTREVIAEIEAGISQHPSLADVGTQSWLRPVPVASAEEIAVYASVSARLVDGSGRNVGEASALAWLDVHGGVLLTDDQAAIQFAREKNITRLRTLKLICKQIRQGVLSQAEATTLVDELVAGGARFPCDGSAFLSWANREGLLE